MATYKRFEDLPVWQAAMELADALYDVTEGEAFRRRHSLRDQMERAALSVSSNIAEGFERGTRDELLYFLYIAKGSCGELRSQTAFCARRRLLAKGRHAALRGQCVSVSKQLAGTAALRQQGEGRQGSGDGARGVRPSSRGDRPPRPREGPRPDAPARRRIHRAVNPLVGNPACRPLRHLPSAI